MDANILSTICDREWILTNGLGGYALGFGNMINKRKYNGLLTASSTSLKRMHILASVEERAEFEDTYFFMDSNHYPNCIHPDGREHIVCSWLRPYPCVLYSTNPPRKNYLIFKELFMPKGANAVVVKYTNLSHKFVTMILHPKFTLRDHHFVNSQGTWDSMQLEKTIDGGVMHIKRRDNNCDAFIYIEKGAMIPADTIYRSVYFPIEAFRGYESVEDVVSPVRIDVPLSPGESYCMVVSAEALENPLDMARGAEDFYKRYPLPASHPAELDPTLLIEQGSQWEVMFDRKAYVEILKQAAMDFIVGNEDIIAGYPWFGPWGRDTMISMESLEYLPDGNNIALNVLRKYGSHLNNGLLPNTFGEGGSGLNYDSIDSPLWYILRCHQYAPNDMPLFKKVCSIVLSYLYESHQSFYIDRDGLIEIRADSRALTWMDAKVYEVPVTPRFGKPVEVNALWFNALRIAVDMARRLEFKALSINSYQCTLEEAEELISKVRGSLLKFVGDDYLADRLENDEPIWEVRPNAIIALSLPHDFVDKDFINRAWVKAKGELLTPFGLRSLSPKNPAFKQKYVGNQRQRDLAYHQGTVWAYLLLPFVKVALKVRAPLNARDGIYREIAGWVLEFRNQLMRGEISSAAEVWDGIEPFFPKGSPAQAWSVFALLGIEEGLVK